MVDDADTKTQTDQHVDGTAIPSISRTDDDGPVDGLEDEIHYRLMSGVRDAQPMQLTLGETARRNELSDHERLITIDAWMTYLRNEYTMDKAVRYADPYGQRREQVRERDNYACQMCPIEERDLSSELQVHHITPPEVIDDEALAQSPSNLISVCMGCHHRIEGLSRVETLRRCRNPDHLRGGLND